MDKKDQSMRRKRINRIKSSIILTVGIWIVLSFVIFIGMIVKIAHLENKIETLVKNTNNDQKVEIEESALSKIANSITSQPFDQNDIADMAYSLSKNLDESEDSLSKNEYQEVDNLLQEGMRQKVYLTFDDGPSEHTVKILDTLKEKELKATFFVIGQEDEESKEIYRRIVSEGHTLGMHSFSHKYSVIYDSLESFSDDLTRLSDYLTEVTGITPNIMRFPGGSSNKVSNTDMIEFIHYLNEKGITYYDWNVASGDASSQAYTTRELIDNVLKDVKDRDTSIVLMHDSSTNGTTAEALGAIINELQAMNVDILPIDGNTKQIQHLTADNIN